LSINLHVINQKGNKKEGRRGKGKRALRKRESNIYPCINKKNSPPRNVGELDTLAYSASIYRHISDISLTNQSSLPAP
jgi:hypothetical protein